MKLSKKLSYIVIAFTSISCLNITIAQLCRSYKIDLTKKNPGEFDRQPGSCVSIRRCPSLIRILTQDRINMEELRMLQQLTCVADNVDPQVCCPLTDIEPEDDKVDSKTTQYRDRSKLQVHPNFIRLIPQLDLCSSSITSNRILGGTVVAHGTLPWMARLGYKNKHNGQIEYYCGGSVISSRYILSAAHCTADLPEDTLQLAEVRLGEHDTNRTLDCNDELNECSIPSDYKIEKIIPHPGYNKNTKEDDISLIRVDKDISFDTYFVRPICLPFFKWYGLEEPKIFETPSVSGWGKVEWNFPNSSRFLQEVKLPFVSNDKCQAIYKKRVRISDKQLCAGGQEGRDSCSGDSGGPLQVPVIVPEIGSKTFQVGVVSFGPVRCGIGNLAGVYTRISSYLPWILNTMKP